MANRVIRDSIWNSPTLAGLPNYIEDQFPRWLLMADDWGCFNAGPDVIKGLICPKRKMETPAKVLQIRNELNKAGLLFVWAEPDGREWGYFVKWEDHHNFCNKTHQDSDGKQLRHKRKTPEPPKKELAEYLERFRAGQNKYRKPIPNPKLKNPSCSDSEKLESKRRKYTKWDEQFAIAMKQDISTIDPNYHFNGSGESWANEIRLMREQDKRIKQDIQEVWTWANQDPFWQSNILSPGKFRKKFTQLKLKMNQKSEERGKSNAMKIAKPPPLSQPELKAKIQKQVAFVQGEMAEGAEIDDRWLWGALGIYITRYQDKFRADPLTQDDREWFDKLGTELQGA